MKIVKGLMMSATVMLVVVSVILSIAALVISKTGNLPQGPVLSIVVTVIGCVGVFLGGLVASLVIREKGVLLGGASGLFFICCVVLVSLSFFEMSFTVSGITRLSAVLLSGCIGGILGVNKKQKVKF